MAVIVQKYGGSSVADGGRLSAIAQGLVARSQAGDRLVVVVSAMGKTTDQLISQAREVCADPPRRELDMLVTAGERISMALLCMAIHAAGGQAISFTGSQSGIITDEQHQGARILEVRPQRIEAELAQGRIVIVAGYQGVSRAREITTLGRGGSDTSAVALAAALRAEACEIYSDVDGVYTADPNVCPQARLLPEIPYALMHSMAGAGARVLNADAVEFARRAGVTIVARKTGDVSLRQTTVQADAKVPPGVQAVVGTQVVSRLEGGHFSTLSEDFWAALARLGGRVMAQSPGVLLVDRTSIPGKDHALLQSLATEAGLTAQAIGVVTLVGSALMGEPANLLRRVLAEAGELTQGTLGTDTALSILTSADRVDVWVRRLHERFLPALAPASCATA